MRQNEMVGMTGFEPATPWAPVRETPVRIRPPRSIP